MSPYLWDLVFAAIPIALVTVAAAIYFLLARRRRMAGHEGDPSRLRNVARVVAILAFTYGLLAAFAAFAAVVVTISTATSGGGGLVLPVAASATTLVPETVLQPLEIAGQLIGFGYFSEVTITGTGLNAGAALLYYSPTVLTPVLHAIVAFGISSLATRIERQSGFAPELTRTAVIVGSSLIVIGSLSQLLHGIGTSLARVELLSGTELGQRVAPAPADFTHVAAGVGVLLVGALLHRGVRLERDTQGLV